jgi:N-carbamoyl-L-amino-acid hydrolase
LATERIQQRINDFAVDGDRLWHSIMEMAKIGGTEKGGVCRLALTDLDREARDLFVTWCGQVGCTISVDAMGNIFARRSGREDWRRPVMTGSHLDTQPTGGRFDGIYGVMAGLEVMRSLEDRQHRTLAPLELVVWTNEEGSRFAPCMAGSGVFAGVFALDEALVWEDLDGRTIGEELRRIGYAGARSAGGHPVAAYLEAHIEQGPILEAEQKTIGVVTGCLGIRWYDVKITGREAHAGPTPMLLRQDALLGAAKVISEVHRIGSAFLPESRSTVGEVHVWPNSRNVIPGEVFLTVDLRHSEKDKLDLMEAQFRSVLETAAKEMGLRAELRNVTDLPPQPFAVECLEVVREQVKALGLSHMDIVSGAGQDATYMARIAPTGMIFIPCEGGISHNEKENAAFSDVVAGCNVLLRSLITLADLENVKSK